MMTDSTVVRIEALYGTGYLEFTTLVVHNTQGMVVPCIGRGDFCIKRLKLPQVTHGEDLCKHSHESLMGRIYTKHATSYSWGGFMQSRFA